MVNHKILVIWYILVLLFLCTSVNALECTTNFPDVALYPDQTLQVCNMTLDAVNESVSNLDLMFSGIPLNISYTTIPDNLTNTTFNFCLNLTAPYFIGIGTYDQTAHIISNTTPTTCTFNVSVLESRNWTLLTEPFNITVESGESEVIPIIVRNDGNTIIELSSTVVGNMSNVTTISDNVMSYPNLNSTLSLQINVPKSYSVGTYTGDVLIHAKNTDTDEVQKINLTLQIIDTLVPEVTSISIADTMATKPTTLTITSDDNLGIQHIYANFSINKTEMETYPEIINTTTNETIWRQRQIVVPTLLESVELTRLENTNTYTYDFAKTDTITTYWIDILTVDQSNNSISNYTEFKIMALDMIDYAPYTNIKSMKRPKGKIFTTDYNTPITIRLQNVTYAGNFTFEFYDANNHMQGTMSGIGQQLTFRNPSDYYLQVVGDVASDKQGESTEGYMTARFQLSTIPQHVPLSWLTVTTTVINYTLYAPTDTTIMGVPFSCEYTNTGDYSTDKSICTISYPADMMLEEMPIPIPKKMYDEMMDKEQDLMFIIQTKDNTIIIISFGYALLFSFVIIFNSIRKWLASYPLA